MESDPQTWIEALRRSHERLARVIDGLTPEQLRGASYASEWTVAQVLSHLGSGAEIFLGMLATALDPSVPEPEGGAQAIWDRWNPKPPAQQASDCRRVDAELVHRLEALDAGQLAALRVSRFGMDLGAVDIAAMRLSEHAIHTWDVAVALDPSARVSPNAVALLVDRLDRMAARIGKPTATPPPLRVRTSEPVRDFVLSVGEAVRLDAGSGDPAIPGALEIPAEAFLRLVYGRLDGEHTPALSLTGWDGSLDDLRRIFPGF